MRIIIFFIPIGLLVALIAGCGDQSQSCKDPEQLSGIIIGKYQVTCAPQSLFEQFVISNQADLDSVFGTNLLQCQVPEVDFENECVIGYYTSGSGCDVNFHREVERVDPLRRYLFRVRVESCGNCRSAFYSYNWVRVPALPPGWSVDFILQ
jgi:hypothetical protein